MKAASYIKAMFFKTGAKQVFLKIVSNQSFSEDVTNLRYHILERARARSGLDKHKWNKLYDRIPVHRERLETNGNMMYLRHLAYASAVKREELCKASVALAGAAQCEYTHVLYT